MTEQDIYKLLADGERVTFECEGAQNDVPSSLWETCSAFTNTNGGILLLGVYEDAAERDSLMRSTIAGVEDADKIRKDLWNTIGSHERVNISLLRDEDVQTISVNGKEVIAINVPCADYNLRPVYISNDSMHGTYRRNHEDGYHCTEQMIKMMVHGTYKDGNDRMFLECYTMDDIDVPTLEGYCVMSKTNNPEHIWNNLGHKGFLMQLGGYAISRKGGTEGLTITGPLMLGKGLPIRGRFDYLRVDCIDKSNLIGDQRYSDQLTYGGTRGE